MKQQAAPVNRRGRALPDVAFPAEFVRHAYLLAIRRASRDAHRSECDLDAVACEACREHASAIAAAKRALNHPDDVVA